MTTITISTTRWQRVFATALLGLLGTSLAAASSAAGTANTAAAPAAAPAAAAAGAATAAPQPARQKLRIVGGLGAAPRYARLEVPFWTEELPRLSGGRFTAEVVPMDQAGVQGQDMLRLMQLGVVPFGTALFSQLTTQDPEFGAPDLAGLNPDMASLRRSVAAFRPYFEQALREEKDIEVLALYVYPAQVAFCKKPLRSLADFKGRRVRVPGPTSADFFEALGAVPVVTGFNDIMANMRTGNIDCAVTGTMPGNALGLHRLTTHLYRMPITWGLAFFGVHAPTWRQLDPELKALLRRELPRLENAIWEDAEEQTSAGIACNTGAANCVGGSKGQMVAVGVSTEDERRRREIVSSQVLPRWIERCGASCVQLWNRTVAPVTGVKAPPR